jgi:GNAT superfamily N-acetyltransferase
VSYLGLLYQVLTPGGHFGLTCFAACARPARPRHRPRRVSRPVMLGTMKEISDHEELAALCDADTLCLWAAQGLDGRSRAWRSTDGNAVAVAAPGLATRDRLALRGPTDAVASLAREVLDQAGPSYRPLGDRELIGALVGAIPELALVGTFGWMYCWRPDALHPGPTTAAWLPGAALDEVTALLQVGFPGSLAKPGVTGVGRWAGVRDDAGRLAATGTLPWPAPAVGLLAGIAVHPDARGQGLGRNICAFLLAEALRRHEAAALMVDDWNHAALRIYTDLGLRYRALAAARSADRPAAPTAPARSGGSASR